MVEKKKQPSVRLMQNVFAGLLVVVSCYRVKSVYPLVKMNPSLINQDFALKRMYLTDESAKLAL